MDKKNTSAKGVLKVSEDVIITVAGLAASDVKGVAGLKGGKGLMSRKSNAIKINLIGDVIAVNVATFVGYKRAGILGGIFGTLGIISPSLIIIMILANLINSISDYPIVQKALTGINVAVAALLTSVIINFAKKTIKNVWNAIFMLISFLLIFALKVPSFIVILFGLATGIILTFIHKKKETKTDDIA